MALTLTRPKATIEDLYRVEGKAELVNGEIIYMAPTGDDPIQASAEVYVNLRQYAKQTQTGIAVPDNAAFRVQLPNRGSFSPDASFYTGLRTGMKFYEGAPVFAVEVRSEGDYGPAAERAMEAKRTDYFKAETLVVWDVDLLAQDFIVKSYRSTDPDNPIGFRRGEIAHAEPAVPGWTMPVDSLFVQVNP